VSNGSPPAQRAARSLLRYDGRLTTPSAYPHIVRLSWLSYVYKLGSVSEMLLI
jgi:hypothetical protein